MFKTFPVDGGVGIEAECGCRAVKLGDYEQFTACAQHEPKAVLECEDWCNRKAELLKEAEEAQLRHEKTWLLRAIMKEPSEPERGFGE